MLGVNVEITGRIFPTLGDEEYSDVVLAITWNGKDGYEGKPFRGLDPTYKCEKRNCGKPFYGKFHADTYTIDGKTVEGYPAEFRLLPDHGSSSHVWLNIGVFSAEKMGLSCPEWSYADGVCNTCANDATLQTYCVEKVSSWFFDRYLVYPIDVKGDSSGIVDSRRWEMWNWTVFGMGKEVSGWLWRYGKWGIPYILDGSMYVIAN